MPRVDGAGSAGAPEFGDTVAAEATAPEAEVAASSARGTRVPGRMAAAAAAGAKPTAAEVAAKVAAIPREWNAGAESVFNDIRAKLRGPVSDKETKEILTALAQASPGRFMAIIDKLASTKWRGEKSLLEKLMRRGIQDSNTFIGRFARTAALQLGIPMPSVAERVGSSHLTNAERREGNRELREDSKQLLAYFDCANKQDFLNGLGHDVKDSLSALGDNLALALVLGIA